MKNLLSEFNDFDDIKQFQDEYRWLSNFELVKIKYKGDIFASVEHAYVSAKSNNIRLKKYCLNPKTTPGQAKREGSDRNVNYEPDAKYRKVLEWDKRKVQIMEELLRLKFSNKKFKKLLKETGNKHIQEGNRWKDDFWGIDLSTGKGQNILGKIIMKIRSEI